MSTYPNLNNDPELLNIKTKDDEIKDSKYKTDTHNHEKILKSFELDNEFYKKKYKSLIKKKVLFIITEKLLGSGSATTTYTTSFKNLSLCIVLISSSTLLTSIAILITNKYTSKLKLRFTKLSDWISFIIIL